MPFDASTFTKVINADRKLLNDEDNFSAQDHMGLGRGFIPKNSSGGYLKLFLAGLS